MVYLFLDKAKLNVNDDVSFTLESILNLKAESKFMTYCIYPVLHHYRRSHQLLKVNVLLLILKHLCSNLDRVVMLAGHNPYHYRRKPSQASFVAQYSTL